MDRLSLSQLFPNQDEIWRALLFHKPTDLDPESGIVPNQIEDHHLQLIGTIFQEIWSHHYTCIMATPPCPWVTDNAETMVLRITAALPLTEFSDPKV
jgi:hypothetical protein